MAASKTKILRRIIGVERTVIEGADIDQTGDIVVSVRPWARESRQCGRCRRRCPLYDRGRGRRRWRHLDIGVAHMWLEADAPRVLCPEHGPTVIGFRWARHGARFTRPFEDQTAWLATETSKTAVSSIMSVTWRSVGRIVKRVGDAAKAARGDMLAGLEIVGIDEVSYRRHHKYLVVVVDHYSGRLVWAREGRDKKTVNEFFDELGTERTAKIEAVTCDAASWITDVVTERAPTALQCTDPFHVVQWATDAVDEVRRAEWNNARRTGDIEAADVKGLRWTLLKNPENLSFKQNARLADIIYDNGRLYRSWVLKEELRLILQQPLVQAQALLDEWLAWASRSKLKPFVELARRIRRHRPNIENTIEWGLSNGLVEGVNTRLRLIMRRGFGFHSAAAVIALAMLDLGGLCPPLPHQNPDYDIAI